MKEIISFIISFCIGTLIGFLIKCNKGEPNPPLIEEIDLEPYMVRIDSLERVILEQKNEISHLKDSVIKVDSVRTIKIESIKKLPTDSGVNYLKQKLREYEDKF